MDDVLDHVSRLAIQVITCFKVKSRHRRDDSDDEAVFDRAAFRLCIYDDDREKLLDPNAWPNSVRISPWYFRSPGARETDDNQRRARGGTSDAAAHAGAVAIRSAGRLPPRSTTPDTAVKSVAVSAAAATAVATTVPSATARDVSMMSNDDTILTPINADNDGK